jgi:hypothetical protein
MNITIRGEFQYCQEQPFLRFKGGKRAKPPPPPAPTPTPRQLDEEVRQRDRDRRRQRIAAAGRRGTILTEGQSLASTGKATILGRSTA